MSYLRNESMRNEDRLMVKVPYSSKAPGFPQQGRGSGLVESAGRSDCPADDKSSSVVSTLHHFSAESGVSRTRASEPRTKARLYICCELPSSFSMEEGAWQVRVAPGLTRVTVLLDVGLI